jgi:erythromycin esterase-like protein
MNSLPDIIRETAQPLLGTPNDYDALLELVGDARFVLLGEVEETFPSGL